MKIQRTFPNLDFVDVECKGEILKVKYRYPTYAHEKVLLADLGGNDSGSYALSVCQFCIEDIQGLTDENEQPIKLEFRNTSSGSEMKEDYVLILHRSGLVSDLALYYHKNVRPSPLDKKK